MYQSSLSLSSLSAATGAAVFLFLAVLLVGDGAFAAQAAPRASSHHDHNQTHRQTFPDSPDFKAGPEAGDEIATLEAIESALTQASDGATYVWRRGNGRLAGAIRMTKTFRDADGRICRHLEMSMRAGTYTRKTEGIACREPDGVWTLEG